MRILWDEPKRLANIARHGMDFADLVLKGRSSLRESWAARLLSAAIAAGRSSWCSSRSEPKV
jgi:hypothetical protein